MIAALLITAQNQQMLPVGKFIDPIGTHQEVGSYPLHMVATSDQKYAIISTVGFRQSLSCIDITTGKIASQIDYKTSDNNPKKDGLYYGIAIHPKTGEIYVSRGAQDMVTKYSLTNGQLTDTGTPIAAKAPKERGLPYHFAGLSFNSNGSRLLVVNNQTGRGTDFKGSITLYQTESGKPIAEIPTSGFPFAAAYKTRGANADTKAYVASERDACIDVVDLRNRKLTKSIKVGASPVGILFNNSQSRLYVANSGSDTISVIDTAKDKVIDTIMLRPTDLINLPGAGPLGLDLSADERTLYVTLGDMDAVAVVNLRSASLTGYIPTGWLPTAVIENQGNLLITSAKGVQAMNPNAKPVGEKGSYIQDIIAGTVTHISTPKPSALPKLTKQVIINNRIKPGLDSAKIKGFTNPGIKHVIYIIKENRTYDNVLGDIPKGNGDPSLTLFPRAVTPNQHALAERFVLLDNFYVCAEVSQDGWQWSISGATSAYGSRNTPYNYSGRGRSYDTEGGNNGEPVELFNIANVAKPANGYIWEHVEKAGLTHRNYGMYTAFVGEEDKRKLNDPNAKDSWPLIPVLLKHTNSNFRHYDNNYNDSPIYSEYDNFTWKGHLKTYGKFNSASRFDEWNREFKDFVKAGEMPRFQTVRLGNDHTQGTRVGVPTPQSQVADNDYAVGKLVEAVSNSPFWKDTVICVLEDDAQAGIDHVDAHRSIAFVVSPYIQKGTHDSTFYNTNSMLRTIELVLGIPPMNQYTAVAAPINVFGKSLTNMAPFKAIQPARDIVCQVNATNAYRAADSAKIPLFTEESMIDEDLNDILWKSIKGTHVPTPKPRFGLRLEPRTRDADD
ncbi:MAG: bifunctional YncE family protein/alkaline phosphatase family protein [Fimbriimonadaceae bacterium]